MVWVFLFDYINKEIRDNFIAEPRKLPLFRIERIENPEEEKKTYKFYLNAREKSVQLKIITIRSSSYLLE